MKWAIALVVVLLAAAVLWVALTMWLVTAPTPPSTLLPATVPATALSPSLPPVRTVAPVNTATPAAPTPLALCPILATRTPPPGAPTYIPGGPNPPRGPVDPHIEICGNASSVHVGDTLTLTARSVDIGLPYFMLLVKDSEPASDTQIAQVTYDNRIQGPTKASTLFELVSAKGGMYEATFVLRARRAGTAIIRVGATGEIHYGYPGPAINAGGSSEPAIIPVVDQ